MQIQQQGKRLVLTVLWLIKAHVICNHSRLHVVRILWKSIARVADRHQTAVVSVNSLHDGCSLPLLKVGRHSSQESVSLRAHQVLLFIITPTRQVLGINI